MRQSPSKVPPPPNVPELREAAIALAVDIRAAVTIAARYELKPLERLVILRIAARAGDFLADYSPGCQDETGGE